MRDSHEPSSLAMPNRLVLVRRTLLGSLVLTSLASLAGYWNVLDAYFVSDDFPNLRGSTAGGGVFPPATFHPLASLDWLLDHELFGLRPLGFHAHNLLWHIATSVMLALLVAVLSKSTRAALIAGVGFAVHPVHPEAVTWISSRGLLMVGALSLGCVLAFVGYQRKRTWWLLSTAVLLFVLALLSDESALSIPLCVGACALVYDRAVPRGRHLLIKLRPAVPFVALAAVYLVVRKLVVDVSALAVPPERAPHEIGTTVRAFWRLIAPLNPCSFGPSRFDSFTILCALPILMVAFALRGRCPRRLPPSASMFVAGCFLASLVPVLGELSTGEYLEGSRHWYLASLWSCALLGLWFDRAILCASNGWPRLVAIGGVALYLTVPCYVLVMNNRPWQMAGGVTRELVDRIDAEGPGDVAFRKYDKLLDTFCGAFTFRRGLTAAIRRPFAKEDHDLYGWLPGMPLQGPPVKIENVFESRREEGPGRDLRGQRIQFIVRKRPE